jgi:hypothetical protein
MDFNDPIISAHKHCLGNRDELSVSAQCGCFYCLRVFSPTEIGHWLTEQKTRSETAFCPHCGIDAVLGSCAGYPLTREFLSAMRSHWFNIGSDASIPSSASKPS